MQPKKLLQSALNTLIILLITFSLLELVFFAFLKFPQLNNVFPHIKEYVRGFYMGRDRNIIQFMPQCAEYDDDLTYKLKKGDCIVTNREFSVKYEVNEMGVRDDAKSLKKPEIIVLGDSHAMGWGVDQDKAFPSLIEKKSGLKVLNAAISSYGTAREFGMLKKLDKSNLKYLIVQYCSNDAGENASFVKNDNKLEISSEKTYQNIVEKHVNRTKYKPFRFSAILTRNAVRAIRGKEKKVQKTAEENAEFANLLNILNQIRKTVKSNVKIILFEVNGSNRSRDTFVREVKRISSSDFPRLKKRLKVLGGAKSLTEQDYFILDDHMNKNGHRKIADEILQVIMKNKGV